jgi:ClpP class serine protease
MQRNQWAITPEALRAMLDVVDGLELSADDYTLFHAVAKENKLAMASNFGANAPNTRYTTIRGDVGFLMFDGPITPRASWFTNVSGMIALDTMTDEFKALEANPSIRTIVLLMDSPGGSVKGVSDFANLVKASTKTTYGFAWMAASAMYWIATAVDTFVVPDTGMVGSIGTILTLTDTSAQDAKRGIRYINIISSQSPLKQADPDTSEGLAALQRVVDDLSAVFIDTVAANMGTTVEDVRVNFGQGAMIVAARALDAGMVDKVQDVDSFLRSLAQNSSISPSGFSTSATADNKTEKTMGDENNKTLTAQELRDSQPSAVNSITASAADKERERIQSIEALSAKFDNALPSVKAAADAVINKEKFNPSATAASVGLLVIDAVAGAQVDAIDQFGQGRRGSAATAASLGQANPVATTAEAEAQASNERISNLVSAREARMGKGSEV